MGAAEKTASTDLVVIDPGSALEVFTSPALMDPLLARIRAEVDAFVPDLSTAGGRKEIASMAYKVAQAKSYLEGVGKDLADVQKEIPKLIDASRRRVRETLDAWRDEVRAPLTAWEKADCERHAVHSRQITMMEAAGDQCEREWPTLSALAMQAMLDQVQAIPMGPQWEEYADKAAAAQAKAVGQMQDAIARREKQDKEQAELAKLRAEADARAKREAAEKAEQERKDREAKIAAAAAERARIDAEAQAKAKVAEAERKRRAAVQAQQDAEAKAERDAETAKQREAEAKAQAQRDQEAAVQRERDRAEKAKRDEADAALKREADRAHREGIDEAAAAALIAGGVKDADARIAVILIAAKRIPNITISY